jgi:hypothetical protein
MSRIKSNPRLGRITCETEKKLDYILRRIEIPAPVNEKRQRMNSYVVTTPGNSYIPKINGVEMCKEMFDRRGRYKEEYGN